ncbi:MAG: ABC transporter ATP-binding protein [Bacillota bacterium]|nr:ABC transporter ATP-binding protein [Bacillota bacterium]
MSAFQISVALYMSVPLTLFVLLCAVVVFLCMKSTFKKSKALGESLRFSNQKLMSRILEQLDSIKEIKSYGIEDDQIDGIKQTTEDTKNNLIDFTKLQTKSSMLYKVAAAVAIAVLFYISLIYFQIKPAALLVLIYIFAQLWPTFTSFQTNLQNVLSMLPSFESLTDTIADFTANEENCGNYDKDTFLNQPSFCVSFLDVSFAYKSREGFALTGLELTIPDKGMTALVGKSGAGKSTVVDLLLGLIRPTQGQIYVNSTPINISNIKNWRKCIGYVPQDPFLFNGTIRENLTRFNPNASEDEIVRALKLAAAWDFIEKTEQGLNTVIGDGGFRLSGGERQRIVLARALLRNPRILVLDEATSSLDTENEYKIQEAIENLAGSMTIVVIVHRLSTIVNADNIIVMDGGRIVEQGSYTELAGKEDGYFKKYLVYNTVTPR